MYCHGNCGRYEILIFTNFGKVSICLLNRLICFGISRLHMLKGAFEYVWGNFSFSQRKKKQITKVQSHVKKSSCLFYLSFNSDFYVSKIMHL